ncbi:MAG TPA: enoyl-CoA hydratase/isomerase family protein [Solirubrobacterales bacterium]|nr:enoyl-CoA hydratase/isomerase family protein [Solirubrobacterales bacterium]
MISYSVEGGLATALLDRADKLNAMARPFWADLEKVLATAEADPEVRALIFRGAGRCFSVGGDIEGFGELVDAGDRRAYVREALNALRAIEEFPKPTIAAVHGHALGGGCELTIVCDIVVADETAKFGMPETQVGLVPGLGVARGLAQLNLHWMKYLIFTGETIGAADARLAGLVNVVTPEGGHVEEAERLGARIAARAPLALALGKSLLNGHVDEGYAHAIDAVAFLQGTNDQAEGIAAFEERRQPRFEGR